MFADNLATPQSEGNIFRSEFASKFGSSYVTHAGIVNPDGTYDAKGGGSQYYLPGKNTLLRIA